MLDCDCIWSTYSERHCEILKNAIVKLKQQTFLSPILYMTAVITCIRIDISVCDETKNKHTQKEVGMSRCSVADSGLAPAIGMIMNTLTYNSLS